MVMVSELTCQRRKDCRFEFEGLAKCVFQIIGDHELAFRVWLSHSASSRPTMSRCSEFTGFGTIREFLSFESESENEYFYPSLHALNDRKEDVSSWSANQTPRKKKKKKTYIKNLKRYFANVNSAWKIAKNKTKNWGISEESTYFFYVVSSDWVCPLKIFLWIFYSFIWWLEKTFFVPS